VPDLAAVVLSYRNEDTILAAVDSLLGQDEPVELVVSHSGPGDTAELLRRERPDVRVVASAGRLLPGAARNAGIAATRAPFVSFLAGDCRALQGWTSGRARRHRAGAAAVASAVVPDGDRPPAVAGCLLLHGYRLPGLTVPPELRFGLSYSREALERHGPFPEDREYGEDDAVNHRLLAVGLVAELADDVVTAHAYPATWAALIGDQFRRGRLRQLYSTDGRTRLVRDALVEAPRGLRRARRSPAVRYGAARLAPLLAAGALARAGGIAVGGLGGAGPSGLRERLR
jgi:GT2 family glycosyltransferase